MKQINSSIFYKKTVLCNLLNKLTFLNKEKVLFLLNGYIRNCILINLLLSLNKFIVTDRLLKKNLKFLNKGNKNLFYITTLKLEYLLTLLKSRCMSLNLKEYFLKKISCFKVIKFYFYEKFYCKYSFSNLFLKIFVTKNSLLISSFYNGILTLKKNFFIIYKINNFINNSFHKTFEPKLTLYKNNCIKNIFNNDFFNENKFLIFFPKINYFYNKLFKKLIIVNYIYKLKKYIFNGNHFFLTYLSSYKFNYFFNKYYNLFFFNRLNYKFKYISFLPFYKNYKKIFRFICSKKFVFNKVCLYLNDK
jgi:hypothetical protein